MRGPVGGPRGAETWQGLTLVHGRATLEHMRDTFMGQAGLRGHNDSSSGAESGRV